VFGRDSRKAVLQAIGVISSQRAFTFRTPIESLWAGRISGVKRLTEKSREWREEGGGEGGIMEEAFSFIHAFFFPSRTYFSRHPFGFRQPSYSALVLKIPLFFLFLNFLLTPLLPLYIHQAFVLYPIFLYSCVLFLRRVLAAGIGGLDMCCSARWRWDGQ
jgi:hypothetical protein